MLASDSSSQIPWLSEIECKPGFGYVEARWTLFFVSNINHRRNTPQLLGWGGFHWPLQFDWNSNSINPSLDCGAAPPADLSLGLINPTYAQRDAPSSKSTFTHILCEIPGTSLNVCVERCLTILSWLGRLSISLQYVYYFYLPKLGADQ